MPRRRTRRAGILALLLCAAAALLAPARARAVVTGFQVVPTHFSPNGDGILDRVRFTWTLTDSAADVTLNIASQFGAYRRRLLLGARPAGRDSTEWDGLDSTSTFVFPDSIYKVTIVETPASGIATSAQLSVDLDDTPPALPLIDGVADSLQTDSTYTITGTAFLADSVRVYQDGVLVASLPVLPSSGFTTFFSVPNLHLHLGANQLAVQARDLAGNFSALTTPITVTWVNVPDLAFIRGSTVFFSPNGDGVQDTTHLRLALDAPSTRLRLDVRAGAAPPQSEPDETRPVLHVLDGPAPADTMVFSWDGRDSVGTLMPDGSYVFRAIVTNFNAHGDSIGLQVKFSNITLDNTPPGKPFLDQLPASTTFRNHVLVEGSSSGADSVFVLEGGTRILGESGARFSFEVPLALGPNPVSLQSSDFAGNLSPVAGPYTIDYVNPIGFHANERFRPNDAFVFNLEKAANAIDVTLYTLRGRRVRTLSSREVQLHYDLPWDGKDELGAFAGDGPYVARAQVTYVDGTRTEAKGAVVLVK